MKNGEWEWDNGEEFEYDKFNQDEPDYSGNCILMHTNFRWFDFPCDNPNMNFVCEKY